VADAYTWKFLSGLEGLGVPGLDRRSRQLTATHYDRLGVGEGSTQEEIRLAYLRKARENHPDTLSGADALARRQREVAMVAINAAWFVLKDPDRRRLYDQDLERAAERRAWELEEELEATEPDEPYDWSSESNVPPPEYGPHGNPAAAIARLYIVVMIAVLILLGIAFAYAVVRSGSVGVPLPE
jgi:hypothetical protein